MTLVLRWLIVALSVWVAVRLVPGLAFDGPPWAFLVIAGILGLVNAFVRPILVLLSCPCVAITFGLFLLVVNAVMLELTVRVSALLALGLASEGFGATFLGALVISVVSGVLTLVLVDD